MTNRSILRASFVLLLASACQPPAPSPPPVTPLRIVAWTGERAEGWEEYDRLENEQKYEEASKRVTEMLAAARAANNGEEAVRCLIKWTQLRMALHGWETAVRFLKDEAWPEDLLSQAVLNLYYGSILVQYAHGYSWEINQRERVDTKGEVDLKAWTMEQIYVEAERAYETVWVHREQLGPFPKSELDEYVTANTYPDDIRPTLRDALSYLRVELLADTQGWRPEHSNELFRLDLAALVGESRIGATDLTDPAVHPLRKIAFVLDDLERWHAQKGRPGAALEARLDRLRRLHASFTEADDAKTIRDTLAARLPAARQHPWWSEGKATLAEMVQTEAAPDNLMRARQIAAEGRAAYPESLGGQHCRTIVETIDAPDYSLQAMSHDGAGKRSIAVGYKNLRNLYFRAYARDLRKLIDSKRDQIFPDAEALERLLKKRKPDFVWSVQLAETTDFKSHRKYVTPPMTDPGYYIVIASTREDFAPGNNVIHGAHMIVSDLVLATHEWGPDATVTVLSGRTGEPVPGVRVTLYKYDWNDRRRPITSKTTNARGEARVTGSSEAYGYFLVAEKGKQLAVDLDSLDFYRGYRPAADTAVLVYTDRSIYRPLQKVLWKIVVYRGRYDQGRFRVLPKKKMRVFLRDANYQQVAVKTVTTNAYGTAAGEFDIPAGRLLGHWSIGTSHDGSAAIRVEEYKRPTFETKLLDAEQAMRLNKPATLVGEARYYFGLPVSAGSVRWRIQRAPVYPWWWGYYGWYGYGGGMQNGTQVVATGTSPVGADGRYSISFTPEADERQGKDVSYRYTVTADVTDEGGETRTATKSFRLGFVAVEGDIVADVGFFRAGEPATVTINRTNLDGAAAPGKGTFRLVAVKQPSTSLPADLPLPLPPGAEKDGALRLADDRVRPRWSPGYDPTAVMRVWPDGEERKKGELEHDDQGAARVELGQLPPGVYRLHYETRDAFGATFETSRELVVAGARTELALAGALLLENASVTVGGTARLLVASGLAEQPLFFEIYRGDKRIEQRRLRSGARTNLIELPVTEADRGGFGVTLWLERDHQMVSRSHSIHVPWDNKQLKVELTTFRDQLRPGQKETWTVKVTGPAGKETAVAGAELLAYMYDRSLDFFAPHGPPSPLSLYPYRGGALAPAWNLGLAPGAWIYSGGFTGPWSYDGPERDMLQFYSGYGIGGPGYRNAYEPMLSKYASRGAPRPKTSAKRKRKNGDDDEDERDAERTTEKAGLSRAEGRADNKAPAEDKAAATGEEAPPPEAPEVRTDFSETAFWQPQLLTGADGSVSFTFEVPDSVTSWNVWAHAITKDLAGGSVTQQTRTVKDLMVRPYLPRFLREGDTADLKVVVNNASEQELTGELTFDIIDPATEKSVLARFGLVPEKAKASFTAPKGGSTNVSFPITTPAELGLVAFRVVARSGALSDGELRPLPILPGRMHLAQSRFVTLRKEKRREMTFADMAKDDDPSRIHEQMVVTVDAQLFYAVLQSLPYLVNYPYECTEQTLNRFVSTGIVTSMYDKYPAISAMAKKMSKRETRFERWDQPDPNRRMALEEAPWLRLARGGAESPDDLINVLNPAIAAAHRRAALAKLRKAQTSSGGFPWFPGGPPSPWITLYILHGFSKALEFGVDVPRDMIQRAWGFMHQHYVDEWVRRCMAHDGCWESITFLNYTLSNYPDPSWTAGVFTEEERRTMLEFSFKHWKEHSPYLKGYLSLTLARMERSKDALLVWESVMDSAKTEKDQGTFWVPEDRSWLWYNDSIETHAFAIRTLMELAPKEPKLDGLVLWIFLNKKLNHWKSTRATAEVVYSLAKYLDTTGELGAREEATLTIGADSHRMVFEPDQYTGKKNQIVVAGEDIVPETTSTIVVEKPTPGFLLASATWHFSTERMPAEARGDYLSVTRTFFRRDTSGREATLTPLADGAKIAIGDEIEVQLSIRSKHTMEYVHLRDPRGAGFEPVSNVSRHKWDLGIYWYEEIRDSGANFFFEHLPQGEYTFKYRLRAAVAGTFKVAPAIIQPLYAPEFVAYSAGSVIGIGKAN